jgi:hypothetical protein
MAMQVFRRAPLALVPALLAVCAASGCRTGGVGELARPGPTLVPSTAKAAEILTEHNRNAERIQVLRAKPDLTVTVHDPGRVRRDTSHPLSGRLAMEQPRNFKLVLYHSAAGTIGDIGSNEGEYWFWIKEKTQKSIYYCTYDEADANPQAVSFQPEWIKEAMGLRVISEEEASEITVTDGDAGTLVLTHRPHKAGDKTYTRVTIMDRTTHLIREHQLRTGDRKTLLARAEVPEGYIRVLPVAEGDTGEAAREAVLIPKRLKLSWVQEGLDLDVTFRDRDVKINARLDQAQRDELFVEPQLGKGYSRVNLAQAPPQTASPTTIRESRPAPPSGIRLRAPAPIEDENAADRSSDRGRSRSLALGGDESVVPSLTEEVVGERFPTAPEPASQRTENNRSGWRAATGPGLLRE